MDLELDDDQRALAASVRAVLEAEWAPSAARRLVESGTGDRALWDRIVALDWPALLVPDVVGGMGLGPVEAALVHERCGAALAPGPFFASAGLFAAAVCALGTTDQQRAVVGPVVAGDVTGTVALTELVRAVRHGTIDAAQLSVDARRADGGWRIDGVARSVIDGDRAHQVVVPARLDDGGVGAFVVPRDAIDTEQVEIADRTRDIAHLVFATVVPDDARLGGDEASLVGVVDGAVTVLAAELVGTCGTILDTVREHVCSREQFGVAIGSFQALKHRLADACLDLEAARASVRYASVALAEDAADRSVAASSAKALASDCATRLGREGIQMLGGLGFTWEHDMQLFVKRAVSSAFLFGTAEHHRQRVAALLGLAPA